MTEPITDLTTDARSAASACPCRQPDGRGRTLAYADCCGRFLLPHGSAAPDAERLMRSRYSAFVLQRADYLLATWHPDTRPAQLRFEAGLKWLGLQVRSYRCLDADLAEVEFVARSRHGNGRAQRLHERSRFIRVDGRWLYLDGELL